MDARRVDATLDSNDPKNAVPGARPQKAIQGKIK